MDLFDDPLIVAMVQMDHVPVEVMVDKVIRITCAFDGQEWPCEMRQGLSAWYDKRGVPTAWRRGADPPALAAINAARLQRSATDV